jgi:hypothetical protein
VIAFGIVALFDAISDGARSAVKSHTTTSSSEPKTDMPTASPTPTANGNNQAGRHVELAGSDGSSLPVTCIGSSMRQGKVKQIPARLELSRFETHRRRSIAMVAFPQWMEHNVSQSNRKGEVLNHAVIRCLSEWS